VVAFTVFLTLGFVTAFFIGQLIQSTALDSARSTAYDTLHAQLLRHLSPRDLTAPVSPARTRHFRAFLDENVLSDRTVLVKVWNRSGVVIFSSNARIAGKRFPIKDDLAEALHGERASEISNQSAAENRDDRRFGRLLEVYIPIRFGSRGPVLGAFEIYQTYAPVANQIGRTQRDVYILLAGGFTALYLLLFSVVRKGSNTITRQQSQLRQHSEALQENYHQTIASLAAAVDARDSSTERHSARVKALAVALARSLGLPESEVRDVEWGALLHDVGKIGVSDTILLKPGALTEEEWAQMRQHPEIGYRMLRTVAFLEGALPLVLHHHERWDGSGYPAGLRGEDIPLHARLFAVIDAYDAMTSDRPYRAGMSHHVAIQRLRQGAGGHFDPAMVAALEAVLRYSVIEDSARAPLFSAAG
jgi:putative nucleotidyltransferase with HDIG domain